MNPQTIEQAVAFAPVAANAIGKIGGPVGFVGRAFGLGPEEIDAGIPGWAWLVIGAGAGFVAGALSRPYLEDWL